MGSQREVNSCQMDVDEHHLSPNIPKLVVNTSSSMVNGEDVVPPIQVSIGFGCTDNEVDQSPKTPKDGVFDQFAQETSHDLGLAPRSKKSSLESRSKVVRPLNLASSMENEKHTIARSKTIADDMLVESISGTLSEVLVLEQTPEQLGKTMFVDSESADFNTPGCARLTGVAETCPAAPKKSAMESRLNLAGLSRKLDFDKESSQE